VESIADLDHAALVREFGGETLSRAALRSG
jgi:hypothetical protein